MAAITFGPDARPGPKLEGYVSRLLDEAGAPGFLWAESLLQVLRVPTAEFFCGWVVPDDCIEKASRALKEADFPPCIQGRDCSVYYEHRRHPIPDYHYHTDLFYPAKGPDMTFGVFLYKKSRLFWSFPDPPIGPPALDDPYYMLTSDNRLREGGTCTRGRAPAREYPVKMLIPAKYIEGMLLLCLRDLVGKKIEAHWAVELNYIEKFVLYKEDNPAVTVGDIAKPFRKYFKIGMSGCESESESENEKEADKETEKAIDEQIDEALHKALDSSIAAWREKGFTPPPKKDMLKQMKRSRLRDAYLHRLYVSMKSNNQLPPPNDGEDSLSIPLERRLREYRISFDPKILDRNPG